MELAIPELIRGGVLILATVTMGIMAGVFQLYAYAIMPGLGRTDDRTFVGAFQAIDRAIINPLFLSIFMGAFGFTGLAALFHGGPVLWWVLVALVLYAVSFFITVRINVPLNDALKAAGDPDQISDLASLRAGFEARWVRWNIVRTVLSTVAFLALAWALVEYGRTM